MDPTTPDPAAAVAALHRWLADRGGGLAWLDDVASRVAAGAPDRALFAAFAAAPRHLGKAELAADAAEAEALRPGWRPAAWTRDQAARVLLLLSRPRDAGFLAALDRLFGAADLAELVCLYQALPLLPFPERHAARAAEGLRSNMLPVFAAVALRNPYPAERLDEGAWNQMVLKAVFVGCSLGAVVGLDRRSNAALARMLVDYARERRAAGRPVPADLWRPVGPFATEERALAALRQALADDGPAQQRAAALALAASPASVATAALETARPDLLADIRAGRLSWDAPDAVRDRS